MKCRSEKDDFDAGLNSTERNRISLLYETFVMKINNRVEQFFL
jgi:hypothetical protein